MSGFNRPILFTSYFPALCFFHFYLFFSLLFFFFVHLSHTRHTQLLVLNETPEPRSVEYFVVIAFRNFVVF